MRVVLGIRFKTRVLEPTGRLLRHQSFQIVISFSTAEVGKQWRHSQQYLES